MCLHLASVEPPLVREWLDRRLPPNVNDSWAVLAPDGHYFVLIYPLRDHLAEYGPVEMEQLRGLLGSCPSCAFVFELSRSKGRPAHDAGVALAVQMLREFDGLLEDTSGNLFWSLADLESGKAAQAAASIWPGSAEPGVGADSR